MNYPSEHAEQVKVIQWCTAMRSRHPQLELIFAIPNGGARNAITGAMLKAEGVKAGMPDLFLPVARGGYHGMFIEMKRVGGRLNTSQCLRLADLLEQGYKAVVCVGANEAIAKITDYIEGREDSPSDTPDSVTKTHKFLTNAGKPILPHKQEARIKIRGLQGAKRAKAAKEAKSPSTWLTDEEIPF
jgi:hypothetical protein